MFFLRKTKTHATYTFNHTYFSSLFSQGVSQILTLGGKLHTKKMIEMRKINVDES